MQACKSTHEGQPTNGPRMGMIFLAWGRTNEVTNPTTQNKHSDHKILYFISNKYGTHQNKQPLSILVEHIPLADVLVKFIDEYGEVVVEEGLGRGNSFI